MVPPEVSLGGWVVKPFFHNSRRGLLHAVKETKAREKRREEGRRSVVAIVP